VSSDPGAPPGVPAPGLRGVGLVPALRGVALAAAVGASLLALALAGFLLLRGLAAGPVPRAVAAVPGGLGPTGTLVLLLAVLLAAMGVLSALRRAEARLGEARRARYREWARQRLEAERAAAPRVDPALEGRVEAILLVDLIQSTELITEHGDEVFRDVLRRVERTFIPVAKACGSRSVTGHGDGLLFCFERAEEALEAVRGMYARLEEINRDLPPGAEAGFRASLHVGETVADARGSRAGLAVVKAVRLGSVMELHYGRGGGRNSLVASAEAWPALAAVGATATPLGAMELRGLPGRHEVYEVRI